MVNRLKRLAGVQHRGVRLPFGEKPTSSSEQEARKLVQGQRGPVRAVIAIGIQCEDAESAPLEGCPEDGVREGGSHEDDLEVGLAQPVLSHYQKFDQKWGRGKKDVT